MYLTVSPNVNPIEDFFSAFRVTEFNKPTVNLNDILDILIVAFLIYTVVIWIKETRAWALFKGIFIVLGFSVLASVFKFNTISWIISKALTVGITVIVILFQPELRKALEQMGKTHFNFIATDKTNIGNIPINVADEIVKATVKMAAVKTGALMLIEREVGLGDHERTGIPIDAIVTSQLIINIFEKNTPLHDGAVIIRNNRVAAATCFLPLTEKDLSRELGTRHRAAVGASEVSDALVIVVSEETGAISVAVGGKLTRDITGDELKKMIVEDSPDNKKKFVIWKGRKRND